MEGTTVAALVGAVVGGGVMGAIIIFGYRTLLGKIIERFSAGVGVQVETKVAAALVEPAKQAKDAAISATELIAVFRDTSASYARVVEIVQASNDALKAEKKDVEGRNTDLESRLVAFTTTTTDLLRAQTDLSDQVAALKRTDEEQQDQLDRIGKERDQALAERDAALAQAKVFEQQAALATEHEQAATARAEKQESELAELRSQVTELTSAYKQQIADLTADYDRQLVEVRDRLAEVELHMAELSAELKETRLERDRYKQQADEYKQQAEDAQKIVAERDLTIAQLTFDLAQANGAKATVKKDKS